MIKPRKISKFHYIFYKNNKPYGEITIRYDKTKWEFGFYDYNGTYTQEDLEKILSYMKKLNKVNIKKIKS